MTLCVLIIMVLQLFMQVQDVDTDGMVSISLERYYTDLRIELEPNDEYSAARVGNFSVKACLEEFGKPPYSLSLFNNAFGHVKR